MTIAVISTIQPQDRIQADCPVVRRKKAISPERQAQIGPRLMSLAGGVLAIEVQPD